MRLAIPSSFRKSASLQRLLLSRPALDSSKSQLSLVIIRRTTSLQMRINSAESFSSHLIIKECSMTSRTSSRRSVSRRKSLKLLRPISSHLRSQRPLVRWELISLSVLLKDLEFQWDTVDLPLHSSPLRTSSRESFLEESSGFQRTLRATLHLEWLFKPENSTSKERRLLPTSAQVSCTDIQSTLYQTLFSPSQLKLSSLTWLLCTASTTDLMEFVKSLRELTVSLRCFTQCSRNSDSLSLRIKMRSSTQSQSESLGSNRD